MSFTITGENTGDYVRPCQITVDRMPLYGIERAMGEDDSLPSPRPRFSVEFKTYDDDGELCHEGFLDDDDECINQTAALRWSETAMGATTIEVNRPDKNPDDGRWTQEIG